MHYPGEKHLNVALLVGKKFFFRYEIIKWTFEKFSWYREHYASEKHLNLALLAAKQQLSFEKA